MCEFYASWKVIYAVTFCRVTNTNLKTLNLFYFFNIQKFVPIVK